MLLTLLLAAASVQTEKEISKNDCDRGANQGVMNQCAQQAWQRADTEMNEAWRVTYAAMKRADDRNTSRGGGFGFPAATLESQRAWLKYRDTQCTLIAGRYQGGSMQPLVRFNCLERMTRDRTRQLRALLEV